MAIVNGAEKIDMRETVIISVNETHASGKTTPETLLNKANKTTIMTIIIKLMKTAESFISACLKIPAIAAEPER